MSRKGLIHIGLTQRTAASIRASARRGPGPCGAPHRWSIGDPLAWPHPAPCSVLPWRRASSGSDADCRRGHIPGSERSPAAARTSGAYSSQSVWRLTADTGPASMGKVSGMTQMRPCTVQGILTGRRPADPTAPAPPPASPDSRSRHSAPARSPALMQGQLLPVRLSGNGVLHRYREPAPAEGGHPAAPPPSRKRAYPSPPSRAGEPYRDRFLVSATVRASPPAAPSASKVNT